MPLLPEKKGSGRSEGHKSSQDTHGNSPVVGDTAGEMSRSLGTLDLSRGTFSPANGGSTFFFFSRIFLRVFGAQANNVGKEDC